jgi:acyl-coenzyme A thioesterase PaaI-like protein
MKASMKNRKAVHNHLKTVHAIAMCNLCEFTGGILMEASIPKHRRWIPVAMTVNYVAKAKTDLTATCDLSHVDWDTCDEVICNVSVRDTSDVEVMNAAITMKVSDKPKK